LGIFYGFGYCPLTDWHFQILRRLGESQLPSSYIKYLVERLSGFNADAQLVDTVTIVVFLLALFISLWLNIRDIRNTSKAQN
jgi:hypothetical protein